MRNLLFFALLSIVFIVVSTTNSTEEETKTRSKRHYYGGYGDYYGDDYWYAGRIFGIIVGSLLLLLCCCTPCVCLAGIWFAGWFGVRDKRERRRANNKAKTTEVNVVPVVQEQRISSPPSTYPRPHPREVIVDTAPPPRPREPRNNDHIIYQAEDRFYSSSAPTSDPRPFRSSNF